MSDVHSIRPEQLLAETQWLQALARCLAGPDESDDLVQVTWLRALEQQPRQIRGLRPWLRTVLRHAFHRDRRDQAARTRRETAAARPEAMPSAAALAARASLHRAVVDAVLSLDEPGRSTVILRFFEDRKPREIARAQGIAVATVHTRLRRALAVLRARLDREQGGREAWSAVAVPAVLEAGVAPASGATATASLAAAAHPIMGVLLMSLTAKVSIGAVCAIVLATGIVIWQFPGDGRSPPNSQLLLPPAEAPASPPSRPMPTTMIASKRGAADVEVPATSPAASPAPLPSRGRSILAGRLLLDAFVPPNLVVVEASPESGSLAKYSNPINLDREGAFSWKIPYEADTLRVRVGAVGVNQPLAEVPGIALRPGETSRDPRLDPLDLRGTLGLITITVVDGAARQVPEALVWVEASPTASLEHGVTTKNGAASLLTNGSPVDLRVEATGFATARAHGISSDTRIVLAAGPRIRFQFDRELAPLPQGVVAKVKLVRIAGGTPQPLDGTPFPQRLVLADGRVRSSQGLQGDERRTRTRAKAELALDASWSPAEVALPEAGTFEVTLMLERQTDGGGGSVGLSVGFPTAPQIVVDDHDKVQAVSCASPTDGAIADTLERLAESIRQR